MELFFYSTVLDQSPRSMRCKPPESARTASGSVLRAERVKAKPLRGALTRGLDPFTAGVSR